MPELFARRLCEAIPGAFMGKVRTFEAKRPLRDVAKTFQARAPDCLNVSVRSVSQSSTSYQNILRPYPSVTPENVVVKSALESGSMLSSMRGSVHIHELDASCHSGYVGTVQLDRPSVALGLPAEHASYLVFVFQGSPLFGATAGFEGM